MSVYVKDGAGLSVSVYAWVCNVLKGKGGIVVLVSVHVHRKGDKIASALVYVKRDTDLPLCL